MILQWLLGTVSCMAEQCIPLGSGTVISKYYLSGCNACTKLAPVLDEIKSKLERSNVDVKIREVECTECECAGIMNFPTVAVTKDKELVEKITGYKDYDTLSNWIASSLNISTSVFDKIIPHTDGQVKELQPKDFLSGFDGQWLILFYSNSRDPMRKHLQKVAQAVGPTVHFGEINKNDASSVINRFNITEYPYIAGINHGTIVPYAGEKNTEELQKFADRLGRRSFESLNYLQLKKLSAGLKNGEPVYIVLYKNYELASHYYNDLAQQFKFRAVIYKSNDPAMFEAAGIVPEEMKDSSTEHNLANHSKMVQLVVYKNGTFYPAPNNLEEGSGIIHWIFHTHFPHVTQVSNENFYTVFHGIKPVFLLVARGGEFTEQLEKLSADMHLGMPYTNILFAAIDVAEYPLFHQEVLPKVQPPSFAIYDPVSSQWYHEHVALRDGKFEQSAREFVEKYFRGKLSRYPPEKRRWSYYLIVLWILGVIGFFCLKGLSHRNKLE